MDRYDFLDKVDSELPVIIEIYDLVYARLTNLQIEIDDFKSVQFYVEKAIRETNLICNMTAEQIEGKMAYALSDLAVGYYLLDKKQSDTLSLNNSDTSTSVTSNITSGEISSIKEGDTTVSFATSASSGGVKTTYDGFIQDIINKARKELACYRRLNW